MEKSLACASMLVEGLCDTKKSKYHGRKLNQGQADQECVSEEESEESEDIVFVRSNL